MRHITLMAALFALLSVTAFAEPKFWKHEWPKTDFSTSSISGWAEILSGGPPKDGIPAILAPSFHPASEETEISGNEPVLTLEINGSPRAYPIRYLMWHEIVNDQIGNVPIAVTYCPLCNSGIVFEREGEHGVLSFGVSGKLRNSDMVMYDHQTESWWQQAIGVAIVGELTGVELVQLPAWMESWDQYRKRNPEGLVMSRPGESRPYGSNPYGGYDSSDRPFLYNGENPPHGVHPLARVVRVGDRAWQFERVRNEGFIEEDDVVITWEAGQSSALDERIISAGRDVGTIRVRDREGNDVAHDVLFAFAFHAFWPDGKWMFGS
ncbi:MAG: DUF3179 domain-containing protein [Roseovarius sp.]|nr:DUF3179 domain-containing protein [Roseovarius sp.]